MKFKINFVKFGFMAYVSLMFYVFLLVTLFQTGSGWTAFFAAIWAWLFQLNTGIFFDFSKVEKK